MFRENDYDNKKTRKFLLEHLNWLTNNQNLIFQSSQLDFLTFEQKFKGLGYYFGYYGMARNGCPIRINIVPPNYWMEDIVPMIDHG